MTEGNLSFPSAFQLLVLSRDFLLCSQLAVQVSVPFADAHQRTLKQNAKKCLSDLCIGRNSGHTSSCGDISVFMEPSVLGAVRQEFKRRKIKVLIVAVTKNLLLASEMWERWKTKGGDTPPPLLQTSCGPLVCLYTKD